MNLNQAFNYFATGIWNKVKNNFVLKELGKSLSTNDYTNEDKSNLDNLVDNIDNMINAPALVNGANKYFHQLQVIYLHNHHFFAIKLHVLEIFTLNL